MSRGKLTARCGFPIGAKIEWLIANRWPSGSPPRTNIAVAAAITAATWHPISSTEIWKLRTGRSDNPTYGTLMMLASFFKVPLSLFDDDNRTGADAGELANLLELVRSSGAGIGELRSRQELPPQAKEVVSDMVKNLVRLEQERAARG
jgi:transcriptional regulator with XRE-family HTH domain